MFRNGYARKQVMQECGGFGMTDLSDSRQLFELT
jgi:hypothetical protein